MRVSISTLLLVVMAGLLLAAGVVLSVLRTETGTSKPIQATPKPRVAVRADKAPSFQFLPVERDAGESSRVAVTDTQQLIDALPKVGSPAPDFTLRALDGSTVTLSKLRGQPVLINFWASWCLACRREASALQAFYAEFAPRGLIVLGVSATAQDELSAIRAYVAEFQMTFPVLLDEKEEVFDAYRVIGLPTSVFVDSQGVIRDVILGEMSRADMLESLERIKTW